MSGSADFLPPPVDFAVAYVIPAAAVVYVDREVKVTPVWRDVFASIPQNDDP